DITHDIFLKIIEKPQLFKQHGTFKSWIYTIARNKCKNAFRDKKTNEGIELLDGMDDVSEQTNSIDQQYFEESLHSTIEKLDLNSKECFVLRFVEGLSIREIAEILQIPEGTVKSRLHFATKKVSVQMKNLKEIFE
ncbi:MAG: RNA polymerase sigma factor, partial [Saprospiraceae bacterium]